MSKASSNRKLTLVLLGFATTAILMLALLSYGAFTKADSSDMGSEFGYEPRELEWDELIPEGVPYGEIIGDGERDIVNDTWKPAYDNNAFQLRNDLQSQLVKIPGFVVPLDYSNEGTSKFLLVPFYGACVHTPPPPPNQIIYVELDEPQLFEDSYRPYWVVGVLETSLQETELAFSGYSIKAQEVELYDIQLPEME